MNFTKKEIQLARDMKEAGLEWKPNMSDWFYERTQDDIYHVCTSWGNAIISFYNDEINEFDIKDCTWLPLWHQCREILTKNGVFIQFFGIRGTEICCYRKSEAGVTYFIGEVKGDTDLDAMYQAILIYVLDAPRATDSVQTDNKDLCPVRVGDGIGFIRRADVKHSVHCLCGNVLQEHAINAGTLLVGECVKCKEPDDENVRYIWKSLPAGDL